jgi:hypothetical protein
VALSLAQEPLELVRVQPVAAHYGAVEEQDWDVQAIASDKLRIGIDVDNADGRQLDPSPEGLQLSHHLVA